eukprot:1896128-Pleurochrysis_carterae.AAC.2
MDLPYVADEIIIISTVDKIRKPRIAVQATGAQSPWRQSCNVSTRQMSVVHGGAHRERDAAMNTHQP